VSIGGSHLRIRRKQNLLLQKYNLKMVETLKIDTTNTHIYARSLSWLDTFTLIISGGAKLVSWDQTYKYNG
jgi:hypothetical protein